MKNHRYAWIEQDLAAVKTRKFFLTGVKSRGEVGEVVNIEAFPNSYVEFIRRFGAARFFRDDTGCYDIVVYGGPIEKIIDGRRFWGVGYCNESAVLLQSTGGRPGNEWPVFEESKWGRVRRVAEGFDAWLRLRWDAAKSRISSRRWKKIVEGPAPFTEEELRIVEARRKFRWRLVRVDDDCGLHFEVTNGADRRLPYLGIGVHGKRRGVWLGIVIRTGHIAPGTTGTAVYDRFPEGMLAPDEIELFNDPDPGPEDREFYWEFKSMPDEQNQSTQNEG